jgi:hypothetical protein
MEIHWMIGMLAGFLLDRLWWESGLDKKDAKVAFLEHYHWGLICWILSFFAPYPISATLLGIGLALIIAEWSQTHPFAYGSEHFILSTVIGAILLTILLILAFLPNLTYLWTSPSAPIPPKRRLPTPA